MKMKDILLLHFFLKIPLIFFEHGIGKWKERERESGRAKSAFSLFSSPFRKEKPYFFYNVPDYDKAEKPFLERGWEAHLSMKNLLPTCEKQIVCLSSVGGG